MPMGENLVFVCFSKHWLILEVLFFQKNEANFIYHIFIVQTFLKNFMTSFYG